MRGVRFQIAKKLRTYANNKAALTAQNMIFLYEQI